MNTTALGAAILVLFLVAGANLHSANQPAPRQTAPAAKAGTQIKTKPFRGKIASVDQSLRTVILQGPKAQTFRVTAETRITKDERPATLADLVAGEAITGSARLASDGKWDARSIYAGKRTPKPAK